MKTYTFLSLGLAIATLVLPGPLSAQSYFVVPINWAGFTTPGNPSDANATRMATILNNTNKYALTTWYDTVKAYSAQPSTTQYYLTLGDTPGANGENFIRPPASEAFALAVSIKTGIYDPAITGMPSTPDALNRVKRLTASLAYRHKVNIANGWGAGNTGNVQTALWASYAGVAGWLLWGDLPSVDQQNIRQMVEYEANYLIGSQVPYYRNAAGTLLSPGDSKGESNAWNAMILQTAMAMMPNHAAYEAWECKCNELMISAFATPANASSTTLLQGRALKDWLYGSNIQPDGIMINHNIAHPDYCTTINEKHFMALVMSLSGAGRAAPASTFLNSDLVYSALVDKNWVVGSAYPSSPADPNVTVIVKSPGGTIYKDGTQDVYYPMGNDWGTLRRIQFALSDAQATAFGTDSLVAQKGNYWEPFHAQKVLDMQNRFPERRTYLGALTPPTIAEDSYPNREEWVASMAAETYLTKWLVWKGAVRPTSTASTPIVIDNLDREFTVTGTWSVAAAAADSLGRDNRYAAKGTGSVKARFTPRLSVAGNYEVYAWWNAFSNHATNAPYVVHHSGVDSTILTNQQGNGGQWNLLGTYSFAAGTTDYVELNNSANNYVTADGVMFVKVP